MIFTCTFPGHYIGGAAVIKAKNAQEAAMKLNLRLREQGLEPVGPNELKRFKDNDVEILSNGDY